MSIEFLSARWAKVHVIETSAALEEYVGEPDATLDLDEIALVIDHRLDEDGMVIHGSREELLKVHAAMGSALGLP